jgi:hypothetical protein
MPDEPELRKIVHQFAGPHTRLLVTDRTPRSENAVQPTVEVAHEALIRTWPRLRQWVDANRDKLRARAAILQAKAEWKKNGKREDLLLHAGFQLERARLLLPDPGDIAVDDIKVFIADSEAADARRRAENAAREHQRQAADLEAANAMAAASRRVARRTLAGLAAALVLALIAVGIGIYARLQTTEAVRQKAEAEETPSGPAEPAAGAERHGVHFRAEQANREVPMRSRPLYSHWRVYQIRRRLTSRSARARSSTKRGTSSTVPVSSGVNELS